MCGNPAYKKFDMVEGWEEQLAVTVRRSADLCDHSGKGWEACEPSRLYYIVSTLVVYIVLAALLPSLIGSLLK
jgi:hypothetical protein